MTPVPSALAEALASRYRIEREAGRGGMATVYLAEDLRHHRRVALKVLDPELAAALGHERFRRETETIASLQHPHILPLFDSGEAAGCLYMVLPFVEGDSLAERLRHDVQLPIEDATRIAIEISDALAYAHARGVVHRDIKPENILFESGHAIVADFGIARAAPAAGATRLTSTGMVLGSPAYMSPEQASGDPRFDGRSDLYSLGCVLYFMLAGQPPFTGATQESVIYQHVSAPVPQITNLRRGVLPALAAIVTRLLQKSPADRYADAAQLARDLRSVSTALAAGTAGAATRPDEPRSAGGQAGPAQARMLLVRVGVPVLIAAALAAGITGRCMRGPFGSAVGKITSLAVLPLANLSGDPGQEYFADGMTGELISELSQIGALRVISRTSMMVYKGARKSIPQIARELNVDAFVEGTVARFGDRVRISAELVRARPEQQLWGERFDRPLKDVLDLQAEVAQAIVQRVQVELTPSEHARLAQRHSVNPAAHDAVLRGRALFESRNEANYQRAIGEFESAIRIDSSYAEAWVGLADALYTASSLYLDPGLAMPRARAAAERGLALDDQLAGAHAARAVVLSQFDWRRDEAERELKRAIELDPNSSSAHYYHGLLLLSTARAAEALVELKLAHDLDPLEAEKASFLYFASYLAGDYAGSIAGYTRLAAADHSSATIHWSLAFCFVEQGRYAEAIAEAKRASELPDSILAQPALAYVYARAGKLAEAHHWLDRSVAQSGSNFGTHYFIAMTYAALGEQREALRWLDQECQARDENVLYMQIEPAFRALRREPGYRDLLKCMNRGS